MSETDMSPNDLKLFKQHAREELDRLLDQINGTESPDLIHLKMKGYGQRITAYRTHDFMTKSNTHGG